MRLILVRHLAAAVMPGVCYGRADPPLAAASVASLPALAASLAAHVPSVVWTSPARRCRDLAAAIGAPLRVDARLVELDFGAWEGCHWDDVARPLLEAWAADPLRFAPPGGESGAALVARVTEAWTDLLGEPSCAVVVSHGGPLRVLAALARGEPPNLSAPAPALGAVAIFQVASAISTRHSASTEVAPSTSPV